MTELNDDKKFKRSTNPAFSKDPFAKAAEEGGTGTMTIEGAINKTGVLLAILAASGYYCYFKAISDPFNGLMGALLPAALAALIVGFIVIFVPRSSPFLAPAYAAIEGVVLGTVSAVYNARFPGLPIQAAGLTLAVLAIMLLAYRVGWLRYTETFAKVLAFSMLAILAIYVANFVMSFFGHSIGMIQDNGMIGIGFSLVVVVVASLNLIRDFDYIERGAGQGAPKYMEWYAGFSLMVTLIWLYLEMLRLLSKLNSRR